MHIVLLDADGNTYATGSNGRGQLCLGDVVSNDDVHDCGTNSLGQLGLGSAVNGTSSPVKLGDLGDVRSVSAGRSFFLADDGAYSAGSNEFWQLCVDATKEEGESRASVPTKGGVLS